MRSGVFPKILYKVGTHKVMHRVFKPQTLTILSLHRISNEKNYFWQPLSPEVFEAICRYVQKNYCVIRFDQIEACRNEKRPLLILSFDDGYYDFIEYAMAILNKYNLPANHNLVFNCVSDNTTIWTQRLNILFNNFYESGKTTAGITLLGKEQQLSDFGNNWMRYYNCVYHSLLTLKANEREEIIRDLENRYGIDTSEKMMNWNDVAVLFSNNVEIGNHSYSHDVISTLTDSADLEKELILSKKKLEEKTGREIDIFSFPNGQTRPELSGYLVNHGYKFVLEMNEKINYPFKSKEQQLVFNRITIGNESVEKTILRIELLYSMLKKITL